MIDNDDKTTQASGTARMGDQTHIAALAYQLANGAKYTPGDKIPVGWDSSRERIFVTVTPEMLAQASAEVRMD